MKHDVPLIVTLDGEWNGGVWSGTYTQPSEEDCEEAYHSEYQDWYQWDGFESRLIPSWEYGRAQRWNMP